MPGNRLFLNQVNIGIITVGGYIDTMTVADNPTDKTLKPFLDVLLDKIGSQLIAIGYGAGMLDGNGTVKIKHIKALLRRG